MTYIYITVPLYDEFKWRAQQRYPDQNPVLLHMGSAVAAGAVADVLCNPAFVVRTRLQTEAVHRMQEATAAARAASSAGSSLLLRSHLSIRQTAVSLFAEGGLPIFWRGMTANLLGLSHVAVQFPVYEMLKHRIHLTNNDGKGELSVADLLLASGLSKISAHFLTYPHEGTYYIYVHAVCRHTMVRVISLQSIETQHGSKRRFSPLSSSPHSTFVCHSIHSRRSDPQSHDGCARGQRSVC